MKGYVLCLALMSDELLDHVGAWAQPRAAERSRDSGADASSQLQEASSGPSPLLSPDPKAAEAHQSTTAQCGGDLGPNGGREDPETSDRGPTDSSHVMSSQGIQQIPKIRA